MAKATTGTGGADEGTADGSAPAKSRAKSTKAASTKAVAKGSSTSAKSSTAGAQRSTAAGATKKSPARKPAAKKPTTKKTSTVTDDTAPGEGPVVISGTEARASEPVLTDEAALDKGAPPPAGTPAPKAATDDGEVLVRAGETGDAGEPEHNAAARVPAPDETTVDGVRYEDVAHPRTPTERLEKREIELGADMDYGEHRRTYQMFMDATKWGSMVVVALLIAMAVGFFMSGGFIGGIVVFFGAVLAGFVFFR